MNVTVQRTSDDGLKRLTYSFYVSIGVAGSSRIIVALDEYESAERQSRRHAFRPTGEWTRISQRGNTIKDLPDVPDDVRYDAWQAIIARIEFGQELR